MKYVVEHLDNEVFEWCMLEYSHISDIAVKDDLIFTDVDDGGPRELGDVRKEGVVEKKLEKACILGLFAEKTPESRDKERFDDLIFGGILGDHPMKRRTEKALSSQMGCETRDLGQMQMSTDTAVLVSKMIRDGRRFEDIDFRDEPEIELEPHESVHLPYRYVVQDGKVVLPKGFLEFIRKSRGFDL